MGANPSFLTLWGWHQTRSGWRRRLKARRQGLSIRTLRGNVSILNLTHVQFGAGRSRPLEVVMPVVSAPNSLTFETLLWTR